MRISTPNQYAAYQRGVNQAGENYFEAQMRVQTGKRLNAVSDNPLDARLTLSMKSFKSGVEQYQQNIARGKTRLQLTESALTEISTAVQRVYTLSLQAANTSVSQDQRYAIASEIGDLQRRVLQSMNTQTSDGAFIFAGTDSSQQPFTIGNNGAIVYSGNSGQMLIEAGPRETLTVNIQGDPLLSDVYGKMQEIKLAVESGNISLLGDTLVGDIQSSLRAVTTTRGEVGGRLNQIDQLQNQHARRIEEITRDVSDIEDVDMTKAIMEYKSAETAYQAALQMASQGFGLSLLDFIRG